MTSTHTQSGSAPLWLKIAAGIGIIWYAFGLMQFWLAYSMDISAAVTNGTITSAHGSAIEGTPLVIWVAFLIASAAGLIGAVLLLRRSAISKTAFGVSLASAGIYYMWVYGISGTGGDRPFEEIIIASVVVATTLAFFIISRRAT